MGAFFRVGQAVRDAQGTVQMRVSNYHDSGTHLLSLLTIEPSDQDYDSWLWIVAQAYRDDYCTVAGDDVVRLRQEFQTRLLDGDVEVSDRERLLTAIPLVEESRTSTSFLTHLENVVIFLPVFALVAFYSVKDWIRQRWQKQRDKR